MTSGSLQRAAFLDRDGTLIEDRHFLADPDAVVLLPNAAAAVRTLNAADVLVIVITNQSGIARGLITEAQYAATAEQLRDAFESAGAQIDAMYHCPHFPDISGPCECRKPGTLLHRRAAAEHSIDLARSSYIGDRLRDVQPAQTLGGRGMLVTGPATPAAERESAAHDFLVVDSLMDAAQAALLP
ncbi:MAG: D-glycero-alpha-D-manno-heptose-1,7-bisphosphate 7-phosphatase [Gemmatimonadaceae bacterium]